MNLMTASAPAAPAARELERSDAYDQVRDAFDVALRARPDLVRESFFTFGGRRVRMRVVGPELFAHLTAPFAHLRAERDGDPSLSLEVDVWDERACHVPYPAKSDRDATETAWPSGSGLLAVSRAARYVRYDCSSWVTWIDRGARRMIGWRANADRLSMHERTRPLPFLLPLWYAVIGVQVIHAGLV
ncbi:MAG: hypothetical protein M3081_07190, partial [Gemmatimonadota bacterium]|nr:hypothetical protein [Gemmatimonadota bacterium]